MKIVILGATGKTGQNLVRQGVERGHEVTAVVRNPDRLLDQTGVRLVQADVTNSAALAGIFKGNDAVMSTLGSYKPKLQLIERSASAMVKAMQATGMKRIIAELSFGGAEQAIFTRPFRAISSLVIGRMLADQKRGMEIFRNSQLDWTIVYATTLTNGPLTKRARIVAKDEKLSLGYKISRANVAYFMLEAAENSTHIHEQPVITG